MKDKFLFKIFNIAVVCLFIASTALSVYFNYYNWQVRKQSLSQSSKLSFLQNDNESISEKRDYYNSDNYRNKLFKTENLKNADEVVIRLETPETYKDPETNEYSLEPVTDQNNFKNWLNCLFLSNTTSNIDGFCK